MEEEIKKAYMDWSEKGVSYLNCMCVYDIMMDVDEALQTCDTILDEIDLGIDYTSREKDIDRLLEGHGTLHRYIDVLNCYVDDKLDQPLKKDFKKNATETISRIHLEDFEVDITLGLTENNYITGGMGYAGTMVEQEKAKLTFADFIGTSDGKADGNGFHMAYTNGSVEDFASIFAAQYEAMKASGALGEDNNLTQQEFLEQFYRQGEFTHDSSNPFLNFVSSVLDITIIKPIIEACTGEDLITGEDLTDMERGLKVVFAVVDLVTLGGAIAATKFSEMGLKEGLKAFGKTALIDFAGNTAACGVGALGETFDWPVPITMMLSLAAGITVSISGNKLLFKNADGIEIGSKTLSDDDLKIVEQTIEGENYSNLTEVVSAKEAEVYLHFLESGSTEGMTESELKAVQKIEELIKSNKIDYDGILKIRNETVKSDVEVVRNTTEDSVEDVGKSAAEDAGKVVESGSKTIITPEMEEKILLGQRKNPAKNELIGGHSPNINNANPNYAVEVLQTNPDGTQKIKFVTQYDDGNLSNIKTSTIFPDSWSDDKIIESIKAVGDSSPIGVRTSDGAMLYRETIDGVQIEVIKIGDTVTSGYPTGSVKTGLLPGFNSLE